jgi:hypothetical protein
MLDERAKLRDYLVILLLSEWLRYPDFVEMDKVRSQSQRSQWLDSF